MRVRCGRERSLVRQSLFVVLRFVSLCVLRSLFVAIVVRRCRRRRAGGKEMGGRVVRMYSTVSRLGRRWWSGSEAKGRRRRRKGD